MRTFLYSRVSTDEQTTENQHLMAANMGYTILPENCYSDSGVSGGVKALQRKEFSKMFHETESGDLCVVSAVDRIGRDTIDVLTTIDAFQAKGVRVCVLAYGNLDLTSDMGRIIVTMAAGFAQLEKSYLKARTKQGMARVKKAGTKLGQPMKIAPEVYEAVLKEKSEGVTLDKLSHKYKIPRNTIHANLIKWEGRTEDYRKEYEARQVQYQMSALKNQPKQANLS